LLYEQGFTINGARNRLYSPGDHRSATAAAVEAEVDEAPGTEARAASRPGATVDVTALRQALVDVIEGLKRD
jgi:hypothetical protein